MKERNKEENDNFVRNCPECNIEITYTLLPKLKRAIKNNSLCRKCSKKGEKNYMYGKSRELHHNYGKKIESMTGENNPAKKLEVREKISKKLIGRVGAMTGKTHSEESKDKIKKSNTGQKRTEETKENIRKATLKQIENGFHSSNPFCKKSKFKDSELHYQGTFELDFLNNYYNKIKIENGKNFYYNINNEKKIYISDFYLPDYNTIIEIKSNWTYNKNLNKNLLKKESVLNNDINFLFIIDKKYEELDLLITNIF